MPCQIAGVETKFLQKQNWKMILLVPLLYSAIFVNKINLKIGPF
jgi:hypothetical protein